MRGVICQKPSDLAEKLTCEPETDIRHCAASPELWAESGLSARQCGSREMSAKRPFR